MDRREVYTKLLKNEARVQILLFLSKNGPSRFVDIRQATGLSTGVIYHHLKILVGYVQQDDSKHYMLSEKGRELLSFVSGEPTKTATGHTLGDVLFEQNPFALKVFSYITLVPLFGAISAGRALRVAVIIAALEFSVIVAGFVGIQFLPVYLNVSLPVGSLLMVMTLYLLFAFATAFVRSESLSIFRFDGAELVSAFSDTELLSSVTVFLALADLATAALKLPAPLGYAGDILLLWSLLVFASSLSYLKGAELIPILILIFSVIALAEALYELQFPLAGPRMNSLYFVVIGLVSLLLARWLDRIMKGTYASWR
jgi:hypothetical protein